jgi:hypothetical protein
LRSDPNGIGSQTIGGFGIRAAGGLGRRDRVVVVVVVGVVGVVGVVAVTVGAGAALVALLVWLATDDDVAVFAWVAVERPQPLSSGAASTTIKTVDHLIIIRV